MKKEMRNSPIETLRTSPQCSTQTRDIQTSITLQQLAIHIGLRGTAYRRPAGEGGGSGSVPTWRGQGRLKRSDRSKDFGFCKLEWEYGMLWVSCVAATICNHDLKFRLET